MAELRKIAIVGSEGAKFTDIGRESARILIKELIADPCIVVSGHCHLGGIDIWAEDLAKAAGLETLIFPPTENNWEYGYKPRNLLIARSCDEIHVISVDKLPDDFKGMTFELCYHCARSKTPRPPHVKSGACWTANQAIKLGKPAYWHVIKNKET